MAAVSSARRCGSWLGSWTLTPPNSPVQFFQEFYTNNGSYATLNADPALNFANTINFTNIERLDVTGTVLNDVLVGTDRKIGISSAGSPLAGNASGADRLVGLAGNDIIVGHSGSDTIVGGEGDDYLQGADANPPADVTPDWYDSAEIDVLTGGSGADLFVLGVPDTNNGVLYGDAFSPGSSANQAIIADFTPGDGDRVQLYGAAANYVVQVNGGDTQLYSFDNNFSLPPELELIATFQGFTGLDLNGSYVTYVTDTAPAAPLLPTAQSLAEGASDALAAAAEAATPPTGLAAAESLIANNAEAITARASAGSFVVDGTNDAAALATKLGAVSGIASGRLTIEGASGSTATFDGDPFGLGSGIVLSTGRAEDLAGANTTPSIDAPPSTVRRVVPIPRQLQRQQDLCRRPQQSWCRHAVDHAERSQQQDRRIQRRSQRFRPQCHRPEQHAAVTCCQSAGPQQCGALAAARRLRLLDGWNLPCTGTQRSGGTRPVAVNTDGAFAGQFVDNGIARLDVFDFGSASTGSVSLGDGGRISFDLTQTVGGSGPLYLYIAEASAATSEQVSGRVSVSSEHVVPDSDLSTDLGDIGLPGDATKLTYAFTPEAGLNQVEFQFVLFSEELPERGGALGDTFSIKVNGIDYMALSDGASATLDNLLLSPDGPQHPDLILNPVGTGPAADLTRADGYTRVLTLKAPVTPGIENVLEIEVKDQGDAFLDSGILIKGGSIVARAGTDFPGGVISLPVVDLTPPLEPATLSIHATDAIRAEGNSGTTTYTFTVTRSGDSSAAASATWTVSGGADASDFGGTVPSGTVSFAAGETSTQVTITVSGDTALEADETFTVTLSNVTGAAIGTASATGTIINDDAGAPLSSLVSSNANGIVGNNESGHVADYIDISHDGRYVAFASNANNLVPGDTNNTTDVFLKDTWTGDITRVSTTSTGAQGSIFSTGAAVSSDGRLVAFSNGNSFDPADPGFNDIYVKDLTTGATVWATHMPGFSGAGDYDFAFADGGRYLVFSSLKSVLPPAVDNGLSDVFVADLQTPGSFVRASSTATGDFANGNSSEASISGDGRYVAFTSTATNLAGNDANGFVSDVFVKDLTTGAVQLISASAAGAGGNGQSFRPDISADGRYVVFYSLASNLVAGDTNGGADIFRKDLTTGDIQRVNTLADGSQVQFPGSLAANSEVSISGDGRYVAFWGARVVPGVNFDHVFVKDMQTGEVAAVPVGLDGLVSSASIVPRISTDGRTIAFSTGATNLVTNDNNSFYDVYVKPNPLIGTAAPITVSISDATVSEGDNGETTASFTVTRTGAADAFGVGYLVASGSADAGLDLSGGGGFINFAVGELTKTISVDVVGDTQPEADETFTINLSGATNGAVITDGQGLGTIINDDGSPSGGSTVPTISIGDVIVTEGNAGTAVARLTVSLSAPQSNPVTVSFATGNGTATAGDDFVARSGTLTFAPGTTEQIVDITINGDTAYENDESFLVRLSDPTGGVSLARSFATGAIRNDDAAPSGAAAVTVSDVIVTEADNGTSLATFTVTRSDNLGAFSVDFATVSGAATSPGDFAATSGTLAFAAGGALSQTFAVAITDDVADEVNETFSVQLSNLVNTAGTAFVADGSGTGTIIDNDTAPTLSIADVSLAEGNAGLTEATLTISLSAATAKTVTVDYATLSGSAVQGSDFTPGLGRLTFAPGETSKTVAVQVLADRTVETDETLRVILANAVNATMLDGQAQLHSPQ